MTVKTPILRTSLTFITALTRSVNTRELTRSITRYYVTTFTHYLSSYLEIIYMIMSINWSPHLSSFALLTITQGQRDARQSAKSIKRVINDAYLRLSSLVFSRHLKYCGQAVASNISNSLNLSFHSLPHTAINTYKQAASINEALITVYKPPRLLFFPLKCYRRCR